MFSERADSKAPRVSGGGGGGRGQFIPNRTDLCCIRKKLPLSPPYLASRGKLGKRKTRRREKKEEWACKSFLSALEKRATRNRKTNVVRRWKSKGGKKEHPRRGRRKEKKRAGKTENPRACRLIRRASSADGLVCSSWRQGEKTHGAKFLGGKDLAREKKEERTTISPMIARYPSSLNTNERATSGSALVLLYTA